MSSPPQTRIRAADVEAPCFQVVGGGHGEFLGVIEPVLPLVGPRHRPVHHGHEQFVAGLGRCLGCAFEGGQRQVGLPEPDREVTGELECLAQGG